MIFQKVSDLFVQWRDSEAVYGLSFPSGEEATGFYSVLSDCVRKISAVSLNGKLYNCISSNNQY